ncbi:MAG TPA: TonB-dependent receptor [Rhodospirillaceae bacterium]|nr:TonB-dependent receptor [Rhodospirillaceae bacterium]
MPVLALAADGGQPHALDTMVVTATRQEGKLLDQPGNTSVIDTGDIDFLRPQRPAEILNQLPGLNIQQGSGAEHITAIRSPALNGGAGQGSFLFLEDGVPLRAAGFGNVNGLYEANLEQAGSVEVVRGPGSALYGSNAVHGLINVVPRAPARQFEGDLAASAGMFGDRRLLGSLSDSFGASGYRLSAEDNHNSGWRQDTRLDEQKWIGRQQWTGGEDSITSTISGQNLNQQTGAYINGKDAYLNAALAKTNPVANAYRRADSVRAMARWQHDLSDSLQLSVTPYTRYTEMDFLMHFVPSQAIQKNQHYSFGSQNAVYKSIDGGHSIIAGTDIEFTEGSYSEVQTKATFVQGGSTYPKGVHYDLGARSTVVAPYLHSEWQVLDHTRLIAGTRLEATLYDYTNNAGNGIFGLYQRIPSRSDSFVTITPKLGAVQQWRDWLSSYVNLSRGARAPQVTDLYELQNRQQTGQIKAESADSAEIGTRGTVDGLRFDTTAYWMAKNHYFYRAADGTNVPNGKTLHRGLEASVNAPLPLGFDVTAAASWALHTYAFNRPDATLINSVRKGSLIPEAPRTLANLRLGRNILEDCRVEVEWVHMDNYFTDNADTHSYGGHELFNLRATARMTDRLSINATVMNLTDRAYADRAAITTTGIDQYFPGSPMTIMAGARLQL